LESEYLVKRHWSPFPGSQRAVETNPGLHPMLQASGIWAQLHHMTPSPGIGA
jgi:hypothetical protein